MEITKFLMPVQILSERCRKFCRKKVELLDFSPFSDEYDDSYEHAQLYSQVDAGATFVFNFFVSEAAIFKNYFLYHLNLIVREILCMKNSR